MRPQLKWACFALLLCANLKPVLADEFLTLDELSDYTPDPTYDPTQDPLHGFCYGSTPGCYSNGKVTPTNTNPPQIGFTIAPGPQTGNYYVDFLVPINEAGVPGNLSFSFTETQGGASNNQTETATATLVSSTPWSGGSLAGYLGISASPSNPLNAWLPYTQAHGDAGATGYYVYQADLGLTKLQPNTGWASGPLLTLGGAVPTASLIVGFLDTGSSDVATANSSAIFISGSPASAPEPGSFVMLGIAVIGLAGLGRMRKV